MGEFDPHVEPLVMSEKDGGETRVTVPSNFALVSGWVTIRLAPGHDIQRQRRGLDARQRSIKSEASARESETGLFEGIEVQKSHFTL